ncbi:peptide deformylase [Bartonella sp. DGB1]|uniref:peptide deformylase n=1 Tax=Bartonella sp. DGB1 TaxID=3239807 RepID=UPI003526AA20
MAIKPIIVLPDPILKRISTPVEKVDQQILTLADDMLHTMYSAQGIGLAAVQIGVLQRVIVVDIGDNQNPDPRIFINPTVIHSSDTRSIYNEGCLSIPNVTAEVERPAQIKLSYINTKGQKVECDVDGLLATCIQHEIDHLDGLLFVDHLSKMKKNMVIKRFNKLQRQNGKVL